MEAKTPLDQDAGTSGRQPSGRTPTAVKAVEAGADGVDGVTDGGAPAGGGLAPLPYDGVGSVAVGTVLWLIALIVMIAMVGTLRHDGHLWWLATAACGFGLGLVGLFIVIRRRDRIRRGERSSAN
ncbi:DUF2530 domain-containing protein [Frankia sp. AgB1.9]|uniref:DUF2530 domain-containing protein n=1 Tax=unclassified Frankia TaxID=2632575 RepID=UPI00193150B2|nr:MULTISPECIES: DUF2530 domain-containing protein [unclassified Frankia]MBL7491459.1 DUF2530 domain-containing protein [Frankia sp. AgW1.1]MBL7547369.1 DUF2530 domain-containing protein [Frankia sp. AgB1.9]MBL7619954.1 DUF2530 domain-containing protein [Frankia sp. AgB1.8]